MEAVPPVTQHSLFDQGVGEPPDPHHLARKTDPHTSLDAAKSLRAVRITQTRRKIIELLRQFPDGLSDQEIGHKLATVASPSGLRTRRAELVEMGLVADSGRRAVTTSGRRTIVWVAV